MILLSFDMDKLWRNFIDNDSELLKNKYKKR